MRRACVVFVVLLGLWGIAFPASADRAATKEERAVILAEIDPAIEYCFAARVSVVDDTWAAVFSASPRPVGCDRIGDGLLLSHRDPTGAWTFVYEGSAEYPPCPSLGLPTPVGVDLEVCAAPIPRSKTTVTCFVGKKMRLKVKPRACRLGRTGPGSLKLTSLRWTGWGTAAARATGRTKYGRVTVRVSRRVDWSTNRFYSRIRVTGGGWGRGQVPIADPTGSYDS